MTKKQKYPPIEVMSELIRRLRQKTDPEGNRKYSDKEITDIILEVENLTKKGKLNFTKK